MISVFSADATDFSSNGLCALAPSSCLVNETLNGEWELNLVHPLDDRDKWSWLQVGNIIKAPVPASMTPRVRTLVLQTTEGNDVYRINTSGGKLNLWSRATRSSPSLAKYKYGLEVQVISTANPDFFEVVTPDGKHGYMGSEYLVFVRTLSSSTLVTGEIVEPRQLRDQPFRIYRIVPELTQVTVYARHLSYDLMDNMIYAYKPAKGTAGAQVAAAILSNCQSTHLFTMFSDITDSVDELTFENTNPMEALLGDAGLIDLVGGELARDWYDIYAVTRVGKDTDIQIRQGKNLLGISYDVDDANVVTRIVPTGENADGTILFLDEKYIDSPNIAAFPHPRWIHLAVSAAKVSDDMTVAQAKDKLRQAAQDELDNGCDLPDISIDVDFINVADTQEYASYKPLMDIFLGDSVRVIVKTLGLEVALRMTEYSYDCLLKRYAKMTLGMASETVAGSMISARQLPAGGIKGMKLALGSIGTGHIQSASIGSLQVKTAAIGSAHIQQASIVAAHIQQAAIQTAHIQDASIVTAKIQDAQITSAKIGNAEIRTANIDNAAITSAKIGDAAITTAKIGDAQITQAKIADASIGSAQIIDASINSAEIMELAVTTGKIADLAVTNAKIGEGTIETAKIKLANITTALIADAAITTAKIGDAQIANAKIANAAIDVAKIADAAVETAKIKDLAVITAKIADAQITTAKIANLAVDSARIKDAAITTAKILDANITSAKIANGAVGTLQVASAAIDSAQIATGAIDTAHIGDAQITTAKIADAQITNAKIADAAITTAKIGDAAITTAKIGAAQITTATIADAAITGLKVAEAELTNVHIIDGSIETAKIADAAITGAKIADAAIISAAIANAQILSAHIADGQISHAHLGTAIIGSAQIQNAAITNAMIQAEAVGTSQIADGSITDAKIVELTANKINAGTLDVERLIISGSDKSVVYSLNNMGALVSSEYNTLDGDTLTPRSITADRIVANAITSSEIAANTITANNILAGTITGDKIKADTITGDKIVANSITANKVSADFGATLDLSSNTGINTRIGGLTSSINAKANLTDLNGLVSQQTVAGMISTEIIAVSGSITNKFNEAKAAGTGASTDLADFMTLVTSWQQFSPTGLTLGKSDSPYKVVLSNTKLSFLQDGAEIAYISNNKLYITASEIVNQFVIGNPDEGYVTMDVIDGGLSGTWRAS